MDGGEPDSPSLRDWTMRLSRDAAAWRESGEEGAADARRVAVEMMTFNYYAATLLDFFCDEGVAGRLESAKRGELDTGAVAKFETLAMARQQFATDPRLSWRLVEQARNDAGLGTW
jgi:hypothetical protein